MRTLAALLREIDEVRKYVLLDLSIPVLVYLDALRHAHQSAQPASASATSNKTGEHGYQRRFSSVHSRLVGKRAGFGV